MKEEKKECPFCFQNSIWIGRVCPNCNTAIPAGDYDKRVGPHNPLPGHVAIILCNLKYQGRLE